MTSRYRAVGDGIRPSRTPTVRRNAYQGAPRPGPFRLAAIATIRARIGALDGRPGLHSASYPGELRTIGQTTKLLAEPRAAGARAARVRWRWYRSRRIGSVADRRGQLPGKGDRPAPRARVDSATTRISSLPAATHPAEARGEKTCQHLASASGAGRERKEAVVEQERTVRLFRYAKKGTVLMHRLDQSPGVRLALRIRSLNRRSPADTS